MKLCHGASKVMKYEKREGGYNRVFIFTMDTGKRVVAKVPTPVAGPVRLAINSEVATIAYCMLEAIHPLNLVNLCYQANHFVSAVRSKTSLQIP